MSKLNEEHTKHERTSVSGRTRRGWEDNIEMDLREIRWQVVDCIHLAQDKDQGQLL
jgi:hypothetical protein